MQIGNFESIVTNFGSKLASLGLEVCLMERLKHHSMWLNSTKHPARKEKSQGGGVTPIVWVTVDAPQNGWVIEDFAPIRVGSERHLAPIRVGFVTILHP